MKGTGAIPTVYGGVQFRSRLEARWAAFFDEMKIGWQYEPVDMGGYIPDFLIDWGEGRFAHQLVVEVKPVIDPSASEHELFAALEKAMIAGCIPERFVVVGASPSIVFGVGPNYDYSYPDEPDPFPPHRSVAGLLMLEWYDRREWSSNGCCSYPFIHALDCHDALSSRMYSEDAWRAAGNKVQWKGAQR